MEKGQLPAYVISLKGSEERRAFIGQQLDRAGIPFQFFDAADGRKDYPELRPGEGLDQARAKRTRGAVLSPPEVGVALSHRRVMRHALSLGQDRVLIMEDDVMPTANAAEALRVALQLPAWVDILYLVRDLYRDAVPVRRLHNGSWLGRPVWGACCQGAYVISASGMRRYLRACNTVDCNMDISTDQYWRHQLRTLDYRPFPFALRPTPSLLHKARKKIQAESFEARMERLLPRPVYWPLARLINGTSRRRGRHWLATLLLEPKPIFPRSTPY